MSKKLIFYHHSIVEMASEVCRLTGAEPGTISWKNFSDGWPNLFIEDAEKIRGRDVVFIANLQHLESLAEQVWMMYALPMHGAKSFRIVIPFYPVGTMERVSVYGEIATAKSLARMLSAIPRSPTITLVDIHALQMQFYFDDSVMIELESAIPLLKQRILGMNDIAIAFPDDGACKRFGKMFPQYPIIICNKVRLADGKKVVTIKEGDPKGKHVIIVDDLTITGGTLIECRNALMGQGAKKVSAYVTHGVFAERSWEKFSDGLFDHIWFTDSCPGTYEETRHKSSFEVFSLAPIIAGLLK